ncbi:hypothetical protein AAG906_019243 [Vitis piasezkii]
MVSEPIPDPGVGVCLALSVWPRNPMGHNEDVVSAWGGICDTRFKTVRAPWAQSGQYLHGWVRVVTYLLFIQLNSLSFLSFNFINGEISTNPRIFFF